MTRGKIASVFATFAVCAFSAYAIDWPEPGGTYTVPADTTVEVGEDDYDDVAALGKIIFANENSVLRFTSSSSFPRVTFQGPGTVVFAEKVLLAAGRDTIVRRTLGEGDENGFVKFMFEKGLDSTDGSTSARLYYFSHDGKAYSTTNATLCLDGLVTNISWYGDCASTLNGRVDFGENIDHLLSCGIATRVDNCFGVVRQRGGKVVKTGSYLTDRNTALGAYFLENGSLDVKNGDNRWYVYGRYVHFRQTGGTLDIHCWQRPDSVNDEHTLPFDFIYGGSSEATRAYFENSTPKFIGAMNMVMMDNATVNAGFLRAFASEGGQYKHTIALNGGVLTMNTRPVSSNVFYSFNGGTLRASDQGACMFGNNIETNNPVWVRIYEKGGCIYNDNGTSSNNQYLYLPNIKEPEGNVVWSIALSEELRGKVWQTPPSVEIIDSTGAGSNAVAIVDYDFDSGKVTNITVACRGENYSDVPGAVTANLRYDKVGAALLSTPLVCTVGPCYGGDVTFAGGKTIYAKGCTNTYHGATIVDMDRDGVYDHPEAGSNLEPAYHSFYLQSRSDPRPRFLNSTSIVVRSGCFWRQSDGESVLNTPFPSCQRLEFYGGHFAGWGTTKKDIVIGGETWLVNHKFGYASEVAVSGDGTLTVDYGAVVTNGVIVTPALKYGKFSFANGAKIAVKNLDSLSNDGAQVLLDLSGVTTLNGTPQVVPVAGYNIRWDATAKKLLGRRKKGFCVSFR